MPVLTCTCENALTERKPVCQRALPTHPARSLTTPRAPQQGNRHVWKGSLPGKTNLWPLPKPMKPTLVSLEPHSQNTCVTKNEQMLKSKLQTLKSREIDPDEQKEWGTPKKTE